METKFQTSFIPKKPVASVGGASTPHRSHKTTSLLMTLGSLIFVLSLVAAGGAFGWKQYLISAQETYKQRLVEREKDFNIDLIEDLRRVDAKISMAKQLIAKHSAVSEVFGIIARFTIENVQFTNLEITAEENRDIQISMEGLGNNFVAVAFQSQVLGQLERYGLRRTVKNPIISDPVLSSDGTVDFVLSAAISPADISYNSLITGTSDN